MPGMVDGLTRFLKDMFAGLITFSLFQAMANYLNSLSGMGPALRVLFILFSMFAAFALIERMNFWSTRYILGWLIGVMVFSSWGFLEYWESFLYLMAAMVYVFGRITRSRHEFLR